MPQELQEADALPPMFQLLLSEPAVHRGHVTALHFALCRSPWGCRDGLQELRETIQFQGDNAAMLQQAVAYIQSLKVCAVLHCTVPYTSTFCTDLLYKPDCPRYACGSCPSQYCMVYSTLKVSLHALFFQEEVTSLRLHATGNRFSVYRCSERSECSQENRNCDAIMFKSDCSSY